MCVCVLILDSFMEVGSGLRNLRSSFGNDAFLFTVCRCQAKFCFTGQNCVPYWNKGSLSDHGGRKIPWSDITNGLGVWFINVSKQTNNWKRYICGGIERNAKGDRWPKSTSAWYPSRSTCIPLPCQDPHTLCTNQCRCKHALNVALSAGWNIRLIGPRVALCPIMLRKYQNVSRRLPSSPCWGVGNGVDFNPDWTPLNGC